MTDFYTLWTDQGLTKLGNATLDTPFNLTTAVVGDGSGNPVIPNKGQTALANQVWSGPVSSKTRSQADPNTIVFEFAIPASAGPFTIREMGLKDADGTLCIVGNWPVTEKPVAADGSTRDMVLRVPLHFENADVVNLVVDPNVTVVTQAALDTHSQEIVDPTKIGDIPRHVTDTQAKKWEDHMGDIDKHYIADAFLAQDIGYHIFRSGLIVQWGYNIASPDGETILFPIAFPNKFLSAAGIDNASSCRTQGVVPLGDQKTGFVYYSNHTSGEYAYWVAVGF